MKIIPINNGYYQIKSIDNQIFKSRISKAFDTIQGSADIMTLDGENYLIGEGNVNQQGDKTNNDFNKVLILNMLARFTVDKEKFKVILTSPPLMFKQQREALPGYLKGKYNIIHNNIVKEITIEEVKVYPETIVAALANNPDQYKEKKLIIIDIGGVTTNGVYMENNSFTANDVFTIRNGMYNLDFQIAQYINSQELELNYQGEDIQYLRKENANILVKHVQEISNIVDSFIGKIITTMDNKGWNYKASEVNILITGGGGQTLFNEVKRALPQSKLSNDPIFDNLKGLEILSRQVF